MNAREFQAKVSWWFTTLFSSIKRLPEIAEHLPGVERAMARADSQIRNILTGIPAPWRQRSKERYWTPTPIFWAQATV